MIQKRRPVFGASFFYAWAVSVKELTIYLYLQKILLFIMKALRIILALYIAFLTTLPCADIADNCGHRQPGDISLCPLNSRSSQHSDIDCCSPFCVCNCCQVNVLTQGTIVLAEPSRVCINTINTLSSGKIQEIPIPFWQPPKVVMNVIA